MRIKCLFHGKKNSKSKLAHPNNIQLYYFELFLARSRVTCNRP